MRFSTRGGTQASVVLSGNEVAWVASRGPDMGIATVSLNGGAAVRIDLYSPTRLPASIVYIRKGLPAANHNLVIGVTGQRNASSTGTRVEVDGFVAKF